MKREISKAEMIEAATGSFGVVATFASRLGLPWSTAKKRLTENPEIMEIMEAERAALYSRAAGGLVRAIDENERWAVERVFDSVAAPADGLNVIQNSKTEISGTVNHRVGVLLIPADLSVDEWQAQAEGAQAKLMADARLAD